MAVGLALSAGLGAVQLVSGLLKGKEDLPPLQMTGETTSQVEEARRMAGTSRAVGSDVAEQRIRRNQANTVGLARQSFSDPAKIAAAISSSQRAAGDQMQDLDVAGERQRLQGQQSLVQSLSQQSAERRQLNQMKEQRAIEENNIKQQRIAAGIGTIGGMARDAMMLNAKSKIDAGEEYDPFSFISDIFSGNGRKGSDGKRLQQTR